MNLFITLCTLLVIDTHSYSLNVQPIQKSSPIKTTTAFKTTSPSFLFRRHHLTHKEATASASLEQGDERSEDVVPEWKEKYEEERAKRPFSVQTPYGGVNLFGLYYGFVNVALGVVWYGMVTLLRIFYFLTRGKLDKNRHLPIFCAHVWGWLSMLFTASFPKFEGYEKIEEVLKANTKTGAMFVANHNSWMDIPFVGYMIGWRNYKFVAKTELTKIPILGAGMRCANHVLLDRKDKRSQIMALRLGIDWLKKGVHLITFPEGTRSKTGKVLPFKKGAFKMACKANAPIIPMSIVGAASIMPIGFIFPVKPSSIGKVIVHDPIQTEGRDEEELSNEVREAILSGLPDEQKPLH